jgi:hypothetical protein
VLRELAFREPVKNPDLATDGIRLALRKRGYPVNVCTRTKLVLTHAV